MCVYSMIMDHKMDEWQQRYGHEPAIIPSSQPYPFVVSPLVTVNPPTREEIDEFRRLLERAREYDRKNNEPDCEMEDKKRILKELAEKLGVDISFVEGG